MHDELLIRCSSLGKIMTDPTAAAAKAGEVLSVGAKTHIRSLAAQLIFGVEFEVSSKQIEKGLALEDEAIAMVGRVRGLDLTKNKERRTNGILTGEADVFHAPTRAGRDTKVPWSVATFPITLADCEDKDYLWQMRGYMMLWDAEEWHVDYCLLDTPEHLIGYEPQSMHFVSHIPEHMRITTWTVRRDRSVEPLIEAKVRAARAYLAEVIAEFDRTHSAAELEAARALQAQQAAQAAQVTPPQGANRDVSAEQSHVAEGSASPTGRGADGPTACGAAPVLSSAGYPKDGDQHVLKAEPARADATDRSPTAVSPSVGSMGAGQAADAAPAANFVLIDPPPPGYVEPETVLTVYPPNAPAITTFTPDHSLMSKSGPADEKPTLKLGAINDWLSPIHLDAAGLALLGINHSGTDKAAKLYKPSDKARIKAALIAHLEAR